MQRTHLPFRAHTNTAALSPVILPVSLAQWAAPEAELHRFFQQALRAHSSRRIEIRILSAIYSAADMTQNSDAYAARVLVDAGLRAPRLAFPADFLDHMDSVMLRAGGMPMMMPQAYRELAQHWAACGEERYALPSRDIPSFLAKAPLGRMPYHAFGPR